MGLFLSFTLMSHVIEVENLGKSYAGEPVVRDVSFTVARGEIFGLLGRNGAGKTTTVEMVQGLRPRDSGRILVLGHDPTARGGDVRRRIGSQLQSSALPARIQVSEAIDLFASFAGTPVPPATLMSDWGLTHLADRAFAKLSGGEQQRLFLALALVNEPEIVFLDELTTGLDASARRQTWHLIQRVRDQGTTVVLVTHFMEEAELLCDRLAIMSRGRIVAEGTPEELTRAHGAGGEVRFRANGQSYSFLGSLSSVETVTMSGGSIVVAGTEAVPFEVAAALHRRGVQPRDYRTRQSNLEDAFLSLTEDYQ